MSSAARCAAVFLVLAFAPLVGAAGCAPGDPEVVTPRGDTEPCRIWSATQQPSAPTAVLEADREVGIRLRPAVDGFVTDLFFHKPEGAPGSGAGALWSAAGERLASVSFDQPVSGWQRARLDEAVPVRAGRSYIVSVTAPAGTPYAEESYFGTSGARRGMLYLPQDGEAGPNGVWSSGAGEFPALEAGGRNFWIDVGFAPSIGTCAGDQRSPEVAVASPTAGSSVGGVVILRGTASDDVALFKVEWRIGDGPSMLAHGREQWSAVWNTEALPNGSHTLVVTATDTSGKSTEVRQVLRIANEVSALSQVGPVEVSSARLSPGAMLSARVRFRNAGTTDLRLQRALLALRPAGAAPADEAPTDLVPRLGPTVVRAGSELVLSGEHLFSDRDPSGTWTLWASYQDERGFWHRGPAIAVEVARQVTFGAALHNRRLFDAGEPDYARTFLERFDSMTPEYELKIAQLQPARGMFVWEIADAMVEFGEANGKKVFGHTLIWHQSLPAWLTGRSWTRDELVQVLEEHIATVVGRYRGRIDEWDVVNEALNDDGSYRAGLWLNTIGPEYIELAFRAARRANPEARLYYNDYGIEKVNRKSTAALALLKQLRERGVPVDGIGMQAHVSSNYHPTRAELETNLARFAEAGLSIGISELDVRTASAGGTEEERLRLSAQIYQGIAAACASQPKCDRFTTWGLTDKYTGQGIAELPLLFDVNYEPKPAYHAVVEAFGW